MFLENIDAWFLDRYFQKWADKITELTGISSYTVASLCGWAWLGSMVVPFFMGPAQRFSIWLTVYIAIHLLMVLFVTYKAYRFAQSAVSTKNTASMFRRFVPFGLIRLPTLLSNIFITLIFIVGMIMLAVEGDLTADPLYLLMFMYLWGLVGLYYFAACTPRPPKPKEITVGVTAPQMS